MGDIKTAGDALWRDFSVDNVPSSGVHWPQKAEVRAWNATIDTEVAGAVVASGQAAQSAEASAVTAQEAADAAARGYLSFALKADMEAYTEAEPNQTAVVRNDIAANNGNYHWDDAEEEWVYDGPDPSQRITLVEQAVGGDWPAENTTDFRWVNASGYVLGYMRDGVVSFPNIDALEASIEPLAGISDTFAEGPSGAAFSVQTADGYDLVRILDENGQTFIAGLDAAPAADMERLQLQMEAVLGDQAGTHAFLTGKNTLMTIGESKAEGVDTQATVLADLCTALGPSLPGGVTLSRAASYNPGKTIAEILDPTLVALMYEKIDTAISGGTTAFSFIDCFMGANDSKWYTRPSTFQRLMLQYFRVVRNYMAVKSGRSYLPPVAMGIDCTHGKYLVDPLILMAANELADKHFDVMQTTVDYIFDFVDNVHLEETEKDKQGAYSAVAWYWWYMLGRKYMPTRIVDGGFSGNKFWVKLKAPHLPIILDTSRVAARVASGFQTFKRIGTELALSDVTVVNSDMITGVASADLEAGDYLRWGWRPITPETSGRTTGAATNVRDSSPYVFDPSGVNFALRSYLRPGQLVFS